MKKMNIAYIGNGKSTNRYHLPFVEKLSDKINVKTIYSRHIRDDWEPLAGVNYTTDINEIYNDSEIDLVVITVPSQLHYSMAKEALTHHKNVLLEKPFASSEAETRELFELAKENNVLLEAYQNRRFDSDFLTMQKVIASGKLGDILEVEAIFDYFRPEIPEKEKEFSLIKSFLYGHASHSLDQIISYFGRADRVHYDVRQLMGPNRMNDYFDIDLYYGVTKVSVKSSFFRLVPRPSMTVYGKKGSFVKYGADRQEEDLKHFYLPNHDDFGIDRPEDYGTITYLDDAGNYHREAVVSEAGDYSRFYEALYETIINGQDKLVTDEQTIYLMHLLETGIKTIPEAN